MVDFQCMQREEDAVSVFMGVPTMYNYMLAKLEDMSSNEREKAKKAAARLRLTVSGSAACPIPIMNRWEDISGGHILPYSPFLVLESRNMELKPSHKPMGGTSLYALQAFFGVIASLFPSSVASR